MCLTTCPKVNSQRQLSLGGVVSCNVGRLSLGWFAAKSQYAFLLGSFRSSPFVCRSTYSIAGIRRLPYCHLGLCRRLSREPHIHCILLNRNLSALHLSWLFPTSFRLPSSHNVPFRIHNSFLITLKIETGRLAVFAFRVQTVRVQFLK